MTPLLQFDKHLPLVELCVIAANINEC